MTVAGYLQRDWLSIETDEPRARSGLYPAYPGNRDAEAGRQGGDCFGCLGRRREQQFVIVAPSSESRMDFGIALDYGSSPPAPRGEPPNGHNPRLRRAPDYDP